MRYTRTKQLIRLTGGKYWEYMPNTRIDEMCKLLSDYELDKTFKWHRGGTYMSWIEFKPNQKETKLIPAK
ncbi:hypothetical protein [Bacillus cereus]|uniref:hypothetical protein n=1 Tax=Bacillus cereus TaxID=1396 RepID=UPI0011A53C7A|nr:hypothetical protein [Bacillus cereus]